MKRTRTNCFFSLLAVYLILALGACQTPPPVTTTDKACRLQRQGSAAPLGMCAAQNLPPENFRAFEAKRPALRRTGPVAAARKSLTWKKSTIIVAFMDDPWNLKSRVLEVANEWQTKGGANISFVEGSVQEADIRVSFLGSGHWSYLGTQARDLPKAEPTMNLQFSRNVSATELRRVTLHEFGHALALIHEHASPLADINWDKNAVYKHFMAPPNCWTTTQVDAQVLNKERSGPDLVTTAFDRTSIMCYPVAAEITTDRKAIGWNTDLSPVDKEFIARLYPKTP